MPHDYRNHTPTYSPTYGRLATAALTQGWSVSHRDLTACRQRSRLIAQRGNTTLIFTFAPRLDDDSTYRLASLTETRLLREGRSYAERSRALTLTDALEVLAS